MTDTVYAIIDAVIDAHYHFEIADDAGEWFDIEEWSGYYVESLLTYGAVKGEPDMGSVNGSVAVTEPNGPTHRYDIVTMPGGDVVHFRN
jgi:hypothetical protein